LPEKFTMITGYIIGGVFAAAMLLFLVYSLIHPEKF
jgi:K+-transporting ATPase KdpF subunit